MGRGMWRGALAAAGMCLLVGAATAKSSPPPKQPLYRNPTLPVEARASKIFSNA